MRRILLETIGAAAIFGLLYSMKAEYCRKILSLIGVADYPVKLKKSGRDSLFRKCYLSFEERGCRFFPLSRFSDRYLELLTRFIEEGVRTPYLYVSLDLDVGSYNFTQAARYMDLPGISAQNLLDIAALIKRTCQRNKVNLAGLDIMEFNMHFLGLETEDGTKDNTLENVGNFITAIL